LVSKHCSRCVASWMIWCNLYSSSKGTTAKIPKILYLQKN
jgi:hypothetical protein